MEINLLFLDNPSESAMGPHIPIQWNPLAKPKPSAAKIRVISILRHNLLGNLFPSLVHKTFSVYEPGIIKFFGIKKLLSASSCTEPVLSWFCHWFCINSTLF